MNRKIRNLIPAGLTAFLLSGGACYELPSTVVDKDIKAADLVPSYDLDRSHYGDGECKLFLRYPRFNLKTNKNREIELVPPANVTFQGKPVVKKRLKEGEKPSRHHISILPCENGVVEFVMTDSFGGQRRDKVNLQTIKLQLPSTPIDRNQDLQIKVLNLAYPDKTDFHLDLQDGLESPGYHEDVINTSSPLDPNSPRPRFDSATKILTIPKQGLEKIVSKNPILRLQVKTKLYYTYPNQHSSPWFSFQYQTLDRPIALK